MSTDAPTTQAQAGTTATQESRQVAMTPRRSAVAPWADRAEVRELGQRIRTMMPGGIKYTEAEALMLSQAAVAHGLDPFNGELWLIKDERSGKTLGLMAGIKGHRRAGHYQMAAEGGGNFWVEFERLTVDEQGALGIPTHALAYRAILRDTNTSNHYTEQIERLMAAGLPWDAVEAIVGRKPFAEGVGYALPDEPQESCQFCGGSGWRIYNKRDGGSYRKPCGCYEKSKMTMVQRSQKRAEADALKRRFDLPFASAIGDFGGPIDDDAIDTEWKVVEERPEPTGPSGGDDEEGPAEQLARGRDVLRGDGRDPTDPDDWQGKTTDAQAAAKPIKPNEPAKMREAMRLKAGWKKTKSGWRREPDDKAQPAPDKAIQRCAAILGKAVEAVYPDKPASEVDLLRHSVLHYLWNRKSSKDCTMSEIGATCTAFSVGGGWTPTPQAAADIAAILKAEMVESGQTEMEV